ncbi:hypothetical protein [Neoaquamicrobium sediminum]|uniref:hypothetical protein n=1 Tax=Neoaquamicrobium sediminum TaxID=1849104 RepID=UPI003BAA7A5A
MQTITDIKTFIDWLMEQIGNRYEKVREYADLQEELENHIYELVEDGLVRGDVSLDQWRITSKMRAAKRRRIEMSDGIAALATETLVHMCRHSCMSVAEFLTLALDVAQLKRFFTINAGNGETHIRSDATFEDVFDFNVQIDVPAPNSALDEAKDYSHVNA